MIKKLKRRFILLAMASLLVMLTVIVAGMNIVNYQKIVRDADIRIGVIRINRDILLEYPGIKREGGIDDAGKSDDLKTDSGHDGNFLVRGGRGERSVSRDEAEESRFFTVTVDRNGSVIDINVEKISAVDKATAYRYAKKALARNKSSGFIDEFRYNVSEEFGGNTIIFLDCGRILGSFRNFLTSSIIASLLGLAIMFAVIRFFAGRIVRPVAESYEKQKRFITDAGHEIKTPLAIIKANIDIAGMELDGMAADPAGTTGKDVEDLRESMDDINSQVDRLTGLTNDLVYLSRMEEEENTIVMTELSLSDLVSETAESFIPLAAENGKMIAQDVEPAITVKGNSKDLEKLVSILLENAVKYSPGMQMTGPEDDDAMPEPPEIKIGLRRAGRNAVLRVANDTEKELTKESLSHVFERFYRTDESRNSETGGHGIGLSMANAIVAAHGGSISADTVTGHEFIVTANLPLA